MQKIMDNFTCSSANWMQLLQNLLVNNRKETFMNSMHIPKGIFITLKAVTCTLNNVNLWYSSKTYIP
jgi:hypothetical protein